MYVKMQGHGTHTLHMYSLKHTLLISAFHPPPLSQSMKDSKTPLPTTHTHTHTPLYPCKCPCSHNELGTRLNVLEMFSLKDRRTRTCTQKTQ